jgi:hypothetical protein
MDSTLHLVLVRLRGGMQILVKTHSWDRGVAYHRQCQGKDPCQGTRRHSDCLPILYLLYLPGGCLDMCKFIHLRYLGSHVIILRVLYFARLLWFTIRYGDRRRGCGGCWVNWNLERNGYGLAVTAFRWERYTANQLFADPSI